MKYLFSVRKEYDSMYEINKKEEKKKKSEGKMSCDKIKRLCKDRISRWHFCNNHSLWGAPQEGNTVTEQMRTD